MKYTIENASIGFSLESIKKRYSSRECFMEDVRKAHPHIKKEALNKVLNKVCEEVFPNEESNKEEKKIRTMPSSKGKNKQEGAE